MFQRFDCFRVERLRLAAHMLRSQALYAKLALENGNPEAERLVAEMEQAERGFIIRAFRAANISVEEAFASSALEGIRRGSEPPYIVVYRNGLLDAPSTLAANMAGRAAASAFSLLAFIFLGLIMLLVSIIATPIIVYTTGRALSKHAAVGEEGERDAGHSTSFQQCSQHWGLVASILTLRLYLPIYAGTLVRGVDTHVVHS